VRGRGDLRAPAGRRPARPEEPITLLATANGFGLNWIDLPRKGAKGEVTVKLVKDLPVRGKLINTEGKPVAGVKVEVVSLAEPLSAWLKTFAGGASSRMPAGGAGGAGVGGVGPPTFRLAAMLSDTRKLLLPLTRVVHVTDSDKDGRFEIRGLGVERAVLAEGRSNTVVVPQFVIVTRQDFDPKKHKASAGGGPRGAGGLAGVMRTPPLFGVSFTHAVVAGRKVSGTVRESGSGKPIEGATILVYVDGQFATQAATVVTDAKGRYTFPSLPKSARYQLRVTPGPASPCFPTSVRAEDKAGLAPVTCDVELIRGIEVTGQVTDKEGVGVRSLVRCVPLQDNLAAKKSRSSLFGRPVATDDNGRFRLVAVPGGNALLAVVDGGAPGSSRPVNEYKPAAVNDEERKRLQIRLRNGRPTLGVVGALSVALDRNNACRVVDVKEGAASFNLTVDKGKQATLRLRDSEGKPVAGALASGVTVVSRPFETLQTDVCSVFALDPANPRTVAFFHEKRNLAAVVTVRGDEKGPITVPLVPTATVTGRALGSDGKPLAGAWIRPVYKDNTVMSLSVRAGQRTSPRTDEKGTFKITGILPNQKITFRAGGNRRAPLIEKTSKERAPVKSGATTDLGDIHFEAAPR
jgi:protocatechuate 3,4-dioxygenase beta subunit